MHPARLHARVNQSGAAFDKVDVRDFVGAIDQETCVVHRRHLVVGRIDVVGIIGLDIDAGVAHDVEHAFEIGNVHFLVQAECDGFRSLPVSDAVVEKLVVHRLVLAQRPGEQQYRDAIEGFDVVVEQVIHRLVATYLLPA